MKIPEDSEELKQEIRVLQKENKKLKSTNNRISNENSSLKTTTIEGNKAMLRWIVIMDFLFFAEIAIFGVCLSNMLKYGDIVALKIALGFVVFTIALLAIINVVHVAQRVRSNRSGLGSMILWIVFTVLALIGAFFSIFSPVLFN